MSISYVAGQMLQNQLVRAGNNLTFVNTANSTPTLLLDISNNRVGVNTATALTALQVGGDITTANITATGNVVTNSIFSSTAITVTSGSAGNITLNPNTTGLVQITGTYGVVIPTGNTAQRPTGTPVTGTLRLNTGLDQLEIWDGAQWLAGGSSGGNVTVVDQQITPDGTSNTYSLTQSATQASILVSLNGVAQLPTTAYTVSGNSITFAETPLTTDIVDIRFLAAAVPPGTIYNTSGNAAVRATDADTIIFTTNSSNVTTITTDGMLDLSTGKSLKLPSYTVAQAANISNVSAGQIIYVSNGDTGNPCLAVYSGSAWRRVSFGANIST